jgi:hypothetical protein
MVCCCVFNTARLSINQWLSQCQGQSINQWLSQCQGCLLSLHSTTHSPLYAMCCMCLYVLFSGVCLTAVTVGCEWLLKNESHGQCLLVCCCV